jgi:hypothetical protein
MPRIKIFPLASLQQPLQPWIPELLAVEDEKLRVEYHPVTYPRAIMAMIM